MGAETDLLRDRIDSLLHVRGQVHRHDARIHNAYVTRAIQLKAWVHDAAPGLRSHGRSPDRVGY